MFHIGDKVIIRPDLKVQDYPSESPHRNMLYCNKDMAAHYAGKMAVVIKVSCQDRYVLDIDEGRWSWCESMFINNTENPCYVPLLFDD